MIRFLSARRHPLGALVLSLGLAVSLVSQWPR